MMRILPAGLLLALASIGPARAATCPQEAQLRADPRWAPLDGENCHLCVLNHVRVGPGARLHWNGVAITEATLARYLGITARMPEPHPVILLRIGNDADCALLARVVSVIERHGDCYGGHCGFGLYGKPTER